MSTSSRKRKQPATLTHAQTAANEILRVCSAQPKGISQDALESAVSNAPKEVIVEALNVLLSRGKLVPCPGVDGKLVYRVQSDEVAAKFYGLGIEDRLVYQEVERAGSSGTSTKDLCMHTNLQHPQLTKVLKNLETRKLVKPVKSHTAKNKKMYILFDLEASREITGGTFYSGQDFDHELIVQLQKVALAYITKEDGASAEKLHGFIADSGLVRGKALEIGDVTSVLDTLVYDGRVEKTRDTLSRGTFIYRVAAAISSIDLLVRHFTSVPSGCECLACSTDLPNQLCPTMTEWLDQACAREGAL